MDSQAMFLNRPAYLGSDGAARIRGRWPSLQRNRRPAHELDQGGTDD